MSIAEQLDALMGKAGGTIGREMSRYGLTLAKVTNIKDEESLNRIKCLPIGAPDDEETDWCYVMTPMGGKERGLFLFPQVDDLVVLAWLDDDPHRPLVLGGFWNNETAPPFKIQDGKAEDYCLKTPKKIEIVLHDEDSKQKLTVTMPSGATMVMDDENKKISIQDKDGNNSLNMDLEGGNIELKAKSKITLSAGKTTITLEEGGNITSEGNGDISQKAKGKIAMEGANVEGKANSSLSLKAASADIKADSSLNLKAASTDIKADASLKLKGATAEMKADAKLTLDGAASTTVSSSGIMEVKGSLVKIN